MQIVWFEFSPKRQTFLEKCIDDENMSGSGNNEKRKKLKELCHTRWVERHDSFEVFVNLYKPLVNCLETIVLETSNWNRETRQDANSLLHSLFDFLC